MVRDSRLRKEKWNAKIDPNVIGKLWQNVKPIAFEEVSTGLDLLANYENKAKKIIEKRGVPIFLHPQYINYARELGELSKNFTGDTLNSEASNIAQKWYMRGLDPSILKDIAKEFGIDIKLIAKFFTPKHKLDKVKMVKEILSILLSGITYKPISYNFPKTFEIEPTITTQLTKTTMATKTLQINLIYSTEVI